MTENIVQTVAKYVMYRIVKYVTVKLILYVFSVNKVIII